MERLPGFRDFYPEPLPHRDVWSAEVRSYIFERWRRTAQRYGFQEYDGPPLELQELYTIKSGEEIVGQLYHFVDKGNRALALRPEITPTLARMVAAHGRNYKKPLKWFAIPQLFRYERQQKGRLREHFQLNADIIGETDPAADAELIALLIDTLRSFGLTADDFVIRMSSRNAWQEFFRQRCADATKAYEFYQAIDKLELPADHQSRAAPNVAASEASRSILEKLGLSLQQVIDFIRQGEPTAELKQILDNLSARGLIDFVKVDYQVIRGLAYYTGVVFEAFDLQGQFRAIAGGGRYDNLIELISGGKIDLPALGFGMGDVVLSELLKERGLIPTFPALVDVFVLVEEAFRSDSLRLIQELRDDPSGLAVDYPLAPVRLDKQFKRAQDCRASFTVQLQKEAEGRLMARVKNLRTREEQLLPGAGVAEWIRQHRALRTS